METVNELLRRIHQASGHGCTVIICSYPRGNVQVLWTWDCDGPAHAEQVAQAATVEDALRAVLRQVRDLEQRRVRAK